MSADEEKAVKDKILIDYCDATISLAILMERTTQLGKELVGLGTMLQSNNQVSNIALEYYEKYLSKETYQELAHLKEAIPCAQNEVARLADK